MNQQELCQNYLMKTYADRSLWFTHGKGIYLYDCSQNAYLDAISGIGVNVLGHSHPEWCGVVSEQIQRLVHTSNLYLIPGQLQLARKLIEITYPGKVFFANSGTEIIEGALKLARKYSQNKYNAQRNEIISFENSFHGRTMGALSVTGRKKYREAFEPLVPGISFAKFNDIQSVADTVSDKTCAVIVEPVQGEGGIIPAQKAFLHQLKKLCDENDIILIFDEIQCGFGRPGTWYACQDYGVEPDVLLTAKGLGNGIPIGAIIAGKKVQNTFQPGDHAHTFGGNPLSTTAGLATIHIMEQYEILDHVKEVSALIRKHLDALAERYALIKEVRSKGLMIAVEIDPKISASNIVKKLYQEKILIGTCGDNSLRLLPPFIIKKNEVEYLISVLEKTLQNI